MAIIKVIKNKDEHTEALELIARLMENNPNPESADGEKLDLLAKLVEDYEKITIPESLPDPVDAILFRMEQGNLSQADLVPFIGSRSKVSEVLSGKRPLSIDMIRALEKGLEIPAKVLLQESDTFRDMDNINWASFPVKEMKKRGYIKSGKSANDLEQVKDFFQMAISLPVLVGSFRKTNFRTTRPMDRTGLLAWAAMVAKKAKKIKFTVQYKTGTVDLELMRQVARLSMEDNGPVAAQNFLRKHGIALVIESVFPQTYLDGATIMTDKKHPIIGMTIRYDRLDNFWFTLMHELAHISLHQEDNLNFYFDNLDNPDLSNQQEIEADRMASEALLPENKWEVSPARVMPNEMAAASLAKELKVHPAVIAGQIRHRGKSYIYLSKMINEAKVRSYFPDIKWGK